MTPGKNRLHLDLYVDSRADVQTEVDRLVSLGASRVDDGWFDLDAESWQVMTDPEGNVFCVCTH